MKKTYFIFLILFLFLSCNIPMIETGSIQGIVKDATTGEPIPFADIFLLENEKGDGSIIDGGSPSAQIDFTTSDENGNFSFTLDYDKNYSYLCGAEKDLYFDLNQEFMVDGGVETGINVEVLLNPLAYVELQIKNVSPYNINDRLTIGNMVGGGYPVFYGDDIDTIICCINISGNYPSPILWYVFKNGIETSFSENVVFNSFDTTYFEINY